MEDTMKVLELLEELEDIVDAATKVPMMSKVMVEAEDVFSIIREIRLALPDDVQQAKWIRDDADINAKILKMKTYDYVDKILYDMQAKMDEMNMRYFGEMYSNLEKTFDQINQTLSANREEIKDLAYKTQNDLGAE